jgi:hypothetical protein
MLQDKLMVVLQLVWGLVLTKDHGGEEFVKVLEGSDFTAVERCELGSGGWVVECF